MFGFFRRPSADQDIADAAAGLAELVNDTLRSLRELGVSFDKAPATLRAAQVIVCETFVVENGQLTDRARAVAFGIANRIRELDGNARIAETVDAIWSSCEKQKTTIDEFLAESAYRDAVLSGARPTGGEAALQAMGVAVATSWRMRHFVMSVRHVLALALGDKLLEARIKVSIDRLRKAARENPLSRGRENPRPPAGV